jgi:hypothetical protein
MGSIACLTPCPSLFEKNHHIPEEASPFSLASTHFLSTARSQIGPYFHTVPPPGELVLSKSNHRGHGEKTYLQGVIKMPIPSPSVPSNL